MAANPELADAGGQTVPTPFPQERLCCTRSGMQIYLDGAGPRRWKAKGSLFLSNVRMVFVANKPDPNGFQAFDLPLVYIRGDKFNQPILGCNNLSGECWPVCENGGPNGAFPPMVYKLFFLEGGVGTFLPLYFSFITSAREADRNQRQAGASQQQVDFQAQMNQAFVDPDDPTQLYLTQPVQQQTASAPVYAQGYGKDEKYEPLV